MKDLETHSREETRDPVESIFTSIASETTHTIQEAEPIGQYQFAETIIGREAYRLSPLSEW